MLLSHTHFNTSHVTVYRISDAILSTIFSYFNTSHVTVYQILLVFFITFGCNFNTSHVTVYPCATASDRKRSKRFQYISCYGLSLPVEVVNKTVFEFQYISCYGLSRIGRLSTRLKHISIHLMLRFITTFVYKMGS